MSDQISYSNETALEYNNSNVNKSDEPDFEGEDVATMNLQDFRRVVESQQNMQNQVPAAPRAVLKYIPEVTDDFIRNFLLRHGMLRTLEQFEVEWYEHNGSSANRDVPLVPDNYLETAQLLHRVELLERDLREHAELTAKLNQQWRQTKKERDFHRANHNRVVQEKNRLSKILQQTNSTAADLTPSLEELKRRCDGLLKQKTMVTLEKDKLNAQVEQLQKKLEELELRQTDGDGAAKPSKRSKSSQKMKEGSAASSSSARKRGAAAAVTAARSNYGQTSSVNADGSSNIADETNDKGFAWPKDERLNAIDSQRLPSVPPTITSWRNTATFAAHAMSVTKIAMHPRKPAVASASDDGTWRLSTVPDGELILSGEGHQNWVAAVAMHPTGTMVATGSGDKTVKLWDFASNSCVNTLKAHTDGVWSLDFQDTGLLLASGSLDSTSRIWDVEYGKCRQTLRGHVEAVNSVQWCANTNILCTGSGDKTVSLWDSRMNCCSQTLYGHRNAVNCVATRPDLNTVASCDAEGSVLLWDIRRMQQIQSFQCGSQAANHVTFDARGEWLAVASDDKTIKLINLAEGTENMTELQGHEDSVLCVMFDPSSMGFLVSCGSDCTVRCWN